MKPLLAVMFSLLAINAFAEPSKPALDQIHSDFTAFIAEKSTSGVPQDQIDSAVSNLQNQIISQFPEAVTYTSEELDLLSKNKTIVTDALIESTYQRLKDLAGPRPMPVIVEFYRSKYVQKSLNPMQKAIYYRLTNTIAKMTTKQSATAKP